jgi:hypothetical protein
VADPADTPGTIDTAYSICGGIAERPYLKSQAIAEGPGSGHGLQTGLLFLKGLHPYTAHSLHHLLRDDLRGRENRPFREVVMIVAEKVAASP